MYRADDQIMAASYTLKGDAFMARTSTDGRHTDDVEELARLSREQLEQSAELLAE